MKKNMHASHVGMPVKLIMGEVIHRPSKKFIGVYAPLITATTVTGDLPVVQHFRYSEINNLWIHIRIQEDIAWFHIHMDNAVFM